ncbi:MAG: metal ABC transporter permease [Andreesenia angusta]|nr:metal ABC transporter permease [Andreesenia angusta]
MLQYDFMRKALIVGFMLSIMIPTIGVIMVNRRTSMIGDALSHTSLAGVGLGLILGINPVIGAIVVCIFAGFSIEKIRKRFPQYGDMATAIIMSTGLGFAALLSDYAPGGNTFESYLFGSISAVNTVDLVQVLVIFIPVIFFGLIYYGGLLNLSIDPFLAKLSGVNTRLVNGIFTLLASITIAISCKIVGALMVASLIVLPVTAALMIGRSYKQTYIISIILGIIYMMTGIIISYHKGLKPGGAIVIIAVIGMILSAIYSKIKRGSILIVKDR